MVNNNDKLIENGTKIIIQISDMLNKVNTVKLSDLESEKTSLIIVDIINGFVNEGPLHSIRVERVIPEIVKLSNACDELKIKKIAFADCHTDASPEFEVYPVHCKKGTNESEIVNEIKNIGGYTLIEKNSTNGFLEDAFTNWLLENKSINNFIVTGDCTDICVQQFALTLKTWFNKKNIKSRIIVPINTVETYDLEVHNGDIMNLFSLYNMMINGIEVVKNIEI